MEQVAGKDIEDAFNKAKYYADLLYGTGSVLEKKGFKLLSTPEGMNPKKFTKKLLRDENHWLQDPDAPAACLYVGPRIDERPVLKKNEQSRMSMLFPASLTPINGKRFTFYATKAEKNWLLRLTGIKL